MVGVLLCIQRFFLEYNPCHGKRSEAIQTKVQYCPGLLRRARNDEDLPAL